MQLVVESARTRATCLYTDWHLCRTEGIDRTRCVEPLELRAGERIPSRFCDGQHLLAVHEGVIGGCALTAEGSRQICVLTTPGEPLMCRRGADADYWLECFSDAKMCMLDIETANSEADVADQLLHTLLDVEQQVLQRTERHIVMLGRTSALGRTFAFVADMARRLGTEGERGWEVSLPFRREDIADYLGLNSETVSRTLRQVARSGFVEFESPSRLHVIDLDAVDGRAGVLRSH